MSKGVGLIDRAISF